MTISRALNYYQIPNSLAEYLYQTKEDTQHVQLFKFHKKKQVMRQFCLN